MPTSPTLGPISRNGRKMSYEQRKVLLKIFQKNPSPDETEIYSISEEIGLDLKTVKRWFLEQKKNRSKF